MSQDPLSLLLAKEQELSSLRESALQHVEAKVSAGVVSHARVVCRMEWAASMPPLHTTTCYAACCKGAGAAGHHQQGMLAQTYAAQVDYSAPGVDNNCQTRGHVHVSPFHD